MTETPLLRPIGRRLFLGLSALGAGSLLFGHAVTGGDGEPGLLADLIGQNGFRIYTVAPIPTFDPATWRLALDGLVGRPLSLSYADLLAQPSVEQRGTFHCVTGWSVPNLVWQGVPLRALLDTVSPKPDAKAVVLYSSDGAYTDSLTLDQALTPDVLLAYNMNGQPLPLNQGLPVRLIVPEMYGYKSVKWVNRIELAPSAIDGYWEVRGYDRDAYLDKSGSRAPA